MQILGYLCLLLIVCSVLDFYKRFSEFFLGFLLMDCISCLKFLSQYSDFGCGFLVFGCFRQLFNLLALFLLFRLGLKVLQFGYHFRGLTQFLCDFRGKSSDSRNGFCSRNCLDGKCNKNISPSGLLEFWKNPEPTRIVQMEETKGIAKGNGDVKANIVSNGEYDDDSNEEGCHDDDDDEDEEVDVMALRKLVKIERQRANAADLELEKERIAAATAAEEAMAMILRLQNGKSLIEMKANQYRRLAEEKQLHDQEVIQSLRWIVMKHGSERSLLEDQLRFFRQKLKLCMKGDEEYQSEGIDEPSSFFNSNIADSLGDALISSLDTDLSPPRKLKLCMKGDEEYQSEGIDESSSFFNSNIVDSLGDALISSLDLDLSPPRKLKLCMKGVEEYQSEGIDESSSFFNSNIVDSLGDALISSLDMDLSPPRKLKLCMKGDEDYQSEGIDESSSFFNSNIADSLGDALIDMDLSPP